MAASISSSDSSSAGRARRRRRRWLRRLAFLGLLVLAATAAAPYILSTRWGTRVLVGWINGTIPGKLSVESLSLCWFRPCSLEVMVLRDLQGREVIKVPSVNTRQGLLRMLPEPMRFGRLQLDRPQVTLHVDARGEISLVQALVGPSAEASAVSADAPPAAALPHPVGQVLVRDGSLEIVRADGRRLHLAGIQAEGLLDGLNQMQGTFQCDLAEGGRVQGEWKLDQLAPQGRLQPQQARGTVRLTSSQPLSIAELAAFALDRGRAGGRLTVRLDVSLGEGGVQAEGAAEVTGFSVVYEGGASAAPIDARLSGRVGVTAQALDTRIDLESTTAAGRLELHYPLEGQPLNLSAEALTSAMLAGRTASLPHGTLEAAGRADLVALARAVPALLRLREDVEVTAGTLECKQLRIEGGPRASIAGTVQLDSVVTRSAGVTAAWEPATLALDAAVIEGRGLEIRQATFTSGFARLNATGSVSEMQGAFDVDLAALHRQLDQVLDLGTLELTGRANGTAHLKRTSESQIDLAVAVTAENLVSGTGGRPLRFGRLEVRQEGRLMMTGSSLEELVIGQARLTADDRLSAEGRGRWGLADGSAQWDVQVDRADLAYLLDHWRALGGGPAGRWTGQAAAWIRLSRKAAGGPFLSDGELTLREAALDDGRIADGAVQLVWSGATASAETVSLTSARLESTIARLEATSIDGRLGERPTFTGQIAGQADLAPVLEIAAKLGGRDSAPRITGRLGFQGQGATGAEGVRLTGRAQMEDLAIGAGEKVIREKQVRFDLDAVLNEARDTLELVAFRLESGLLTLNTTGRITALSTVRNLDLKGEYQGSWEAITALLHELSPGTRETIMLAGSTGSRFEIRGPTASPTVTTTPGPAVPLELATSQVGVSWSTAMLGGLQLQGASLSPALRDGVIDVPVVLIPASNGQVRLGGQIDLRTPSPTYRLAERTAVLENVAITPEVGRHILSRINPLFGLTNRAEGSASLYLEGIELPLGEEARQRGSGRGRLELRDVRVEPTGLFAEALAFARPEVRQLFSITVQGIDFVLRDGRLHYDNCRLIFGEDLELGFRGSVGFDDTVDLIMSLPVTARLLERLGVRGAAVDYTRLLAGLRVDVPMGGTRGQPRLDLARVDVQPLIDRAMKDAGRGLIDQLFNRAGKEGESAPSGPVLVPPGGTQEAPRRPGIRQERPGAEPARERVVIRRQRESAATAPAEEEPGTQPESPQRPRPILRALQERLKERENRK